MKSVLVMYILFIIFSLSSAGFSQSDRKVRLYDIIRKTVNKTTNTILFEVRVHKPFPQTETTTIISSVKERTSSTEDIQIQKRDSWDSGEEQYFKWASLNRRPMESLAGRKRSIGIIKSRRMTGGI